MSREREVGLENADLVYCILNNEAIKLPVDGLGVMNLPAR